ncbi:MAG: hypothetical protein AB1597_06120 [Chloroflexota bacterium]
MSQSPVTTERRPHRDRVIPTRNRWRSLPVNIFLFILIGLALFLGTCQGVQSLGWWSTLGGGTGSEKATITGTNPEEIKGWMTIKQVIDAYKVTPEEFFKQFNIPAGTSPETPLNQLEKIVEGFSVTTVRDWLKVRAAK